MEGCGTSSGLDVPTRNWCHSGVTGQSGGSDNRGAIQGKSYMRLLVSPKRIIFPLFYIYAHVFWSFMQPVLRQKYHCHSGVLPLNHVKLLDHLSDPQEPLINWISSEISSGTLSGLVNSCFICICVHRFPVCVPSFCKQGKPLKPKYQLLRKLLWR